MIFMNNPYYYNIPEQKFKNDNIYTSYSKIGNFLLSGYLGPDGATALDFNKQMALVKSYAEILERRALCAGGISGGKDHVYAINIKKGIVTTINKNLATYSIDKEYPIDSTGTASHNNSEMAVFNSLKELIEKNALFLFWYGKKGKLLTNENGFIKDNKILMKLRYQNKNVKFYLNEYFYPLKVVFAFIIYDKYICSAGVGSSFSLKSALLKSLNEAYLLQWKNESNELVESHRNIFVKTYIDHTEILDYLDDIDKLHNNLNDNSLQNDTSIVKLLDTLPKWIEDIYLIPLYQVVSDKIKCVKVFSPDMYNHIPLKEYINLENPMNKYTLKLAHKDIKRIPNCIVT